MEEQLEENIPFPPTISARFIKPQPRLLYMHHVCTHARTHIHSEATYLWLLLLELVHQRPKAVMMIRYYYLIDVIQQDIARAAHVSVHALIERGHLAKVMHVAWVL